MVARRWTASPPLQRPDDRPAGFQRWRTLVFLHWEVPAAAVAALLPEGLAVDTFEGRAYVGVVPFTMRDVSPWWSPSVPGVSNFHELNVRTYVHAGGRPGVWFFSLDAASSIAVDRRPHRAGTCPTTAPRWRSTSATARCATRAAASGPGPKPAELELRYRIGESIGVGRARHPRALPRRALPALRRQPPPRRAGPPDPRARRGARPSGSPLRSGQVHHRPYAPPRRGHRGARERRGCVRPAGDERRRPTCSTARGRRRRVRVEEAGQLAC